MATFILVHGAFHGAWCWQRLAPLLHAAGHTVLTPDLPASGADTAPITEARLSSYAGRICALIDAQRTAPILVGHDLGAVVCAQTAEHRAWRVAGLVAVCGPLLHAGESVMSLLGEFASLGLRDEALARMKLSFDGTAATLPAAGARELFYQRCNPADAESAAKRLRPQATAVFADPVSLTADGFGRVRRFYVETGDDRALPAASQQRMVERSPCEQVYRLDCDHAPFFSAPAALAAVLNDVAERTAAAIDTAEAQRVAA